MKKLLIVLILLLAFILRFYRLGQNPPSLYWDEASLGYNAYSILSSGRDEHGEKLPVARFIAFGDNKPPGYIYTTIPSIALFGVNEFAVRTPSALAGFLMVYLAFLLTKELFERKKMAYFAAFFLAVSPWSLQLSRAAFEANLAAFLNLAAVYFFLKALKNPFYFILSTLLFIASFYTFNANRIIAPILAFFLSLIFFRRIWQKKIYLLVSFILAAVLLFPSVSFLKSPESRIRLQEVSIFNNLVPLKTTNQRITVDGNTFFSRLIHNRRIIYSLDYLKHLTDNFSGRFLFAYGDVNPRLSVQGMGELYFWSLIPFLLGLGYLILKFNRNSLLLFGWLVLAAVPAGTAKETPHALRIVSQLPVYQIIISVGLFSFLLFLNSLFAKNTVRILAFLIAFLFSFNIFYYLHLYYIHYPRDWSGEWQYGYKQMVSYVLTHQYDYNHIYVTTALGRPYIYFAFYKPFAPSEFESKVRAQRDWFGFWQINALGKTEFGFENLKDAKGRILAVTANQKFPAGFRLLLTINNLSGDPVFYISEKI